MNAATVKSTLKEAMTDGTAAPAGRNGSAHQGFGNRRGLTSEAVAAGISKAVGAGTMAPASPCLRGQTVDAVPGTRRHLVHISNSGGATPTCPALNEVAFSLAMTPRVLAMAERLHAPRGLG